MRQLCVGDLSTRRRGLRQVLEAESVRLEGLVRLMRARSGLGEGEVSS